MNAAAFLAIDRVAVVVAGDGDDWRSVAVVWLVKLTVVFTGLAIKVHNVTQVIR